MKNKGIQCGVHYKAAHNIECYGNTGLHLPNSEKTSRTTASIPFHEMLTDEEVKTIIKEVKPYV